MPCQALSTIEKSYQSAIDAGKINGAVILATDATGQFTYEKALGSRIRLSGEAIPQRHDDILGIASCTKLLTTVAALQCVEEGLLSLTDDIASLLPELAGKDVVTGLSEDGQPITEPQSRPITLELLLTHSSGVVYDFLDASMEKWKEVNSWTYQDRPTVEKRFSYPLTYQPGTAWMYGAGVDWAGKAIERATNQRLGDYIRTKVFEPLGIKDAQFHPVTRQDLRDRMVDLNPSDPEALSLAVLGGNNLHEGLADDFGGQGMFMSAEDFHKVLVSLLINDGKLLKPATVELMFESHLTPESKAALDAITLATDVFRQGTARETKRSFGFGGLLVMEDVEGGFSNRTMAWGGGINSVWFIDRKAGLCGFAAPQLKLPTDWETIVDLKQVFRRDIYKKYRAWKETST